jgi:pimeloyl-ACP methyl ester carboxylesterase
MPALADWKFDANLAERISQPTLSVLGSRSLPFYEEGAQLFRSWRPQTETHRVQGVNHLLQMQDARSVAVVMAQFFAQHPL